MPTALTSSKQPSGLRAGVPANSIQLPRMKYSTDYYAVGFGVAYRCCAIRVLHS